jgi:hypothetical protein
MSRESVPLVASLLVCPDLFVQISNAPDLCGHLDGLRFLEVISLPSMLLPALELTPDMSRLLLARPNLALSPFESESVKRYKSNRRASHYAAHRSVSAPMNRAF